MRRMLAAILFFLCLAPAFAQAPPPVPALPDTERRTSYTISATTGPLSVGFALYGDSTDYGDWIQVWLNGVLQSSSTYTLTSPTGPLATIPRPITNAEITFTAATTGTVQIVGARRPRRLSQFSENRGVSARDLNQALTDLVAQNREQWDLIENRVIQGIPGETLSPLPPAASRAGRLLGFDGNGNTTTYDLGSGGGGGGGGGITVLNCTAPINCTPNPVVSIGSVTFDVSGVTPGTYGGASTHNILTIDSYGRITGATTVPAQTTWGDITGKPTTLTGFGIASPLPIAQGGTGAQTFTANAPVLGNGIGPLLSSTRSGTTTNFATVSGALTNGNCVQIDVGGNFVDAGGACSTTAGATYTNVVAEGATGDCSTDDTVAVQAAIATASAAGGPGVVYFPPVPSGGCYKITKLNATAKTNLKFLGNGPSSLIKVTGKDASNNWLDISCSNGITLQNLKIIEDGVAVPDNIILWGWCGTVYQSGLLIDRVDMDISFIKSGLYAFGYTGGGSLASEGNSANIGRGLTIKDSTWYGRYGPGNGGQSDPSLRSALLQVRGQNTLGVTSAYQTLGGNGLAWSTLLQNVHLIDAPAGYGAGTRDNNAALICYNCGAVLQIIGGSLQCLCETPFVSWYFTEGVHITGTRVGASDQSTTTAIYAFRFGGPSGAETTGNVTLEHFFLAGSLNAAGAVIGQENPGAVGGPNQAVMARFRVISPEIGGATVAMIAPTGLACTLPQTPLSNWIGIESHIDASGLPLTLCGSADFTTIIKNPGTITNSNPGVQTTGCKYRIATQPSCGTSTTGGP